jgi:hypothetical protein
LPLPLESRDSGGGVHVIAWLKEPIEAGTSEFDRANAARKRLTYLLAGDPAPDHAAALLRRVGTCNFKYGEPRLCHVVQAGEPVDVTEIEELVEHLGDAPLFVAKPGQPKPRQPKTNGHDTAASAPKQPIDAAADLAAMVFEDKDHGIHNTQLTVTASRLRSGMPVDEVVAEVEHIREQFYRRFVHGEEDTNRAANAKRMAFKRQRAASTGRGRGYRSDCQRRRYSSAFGPSGKERHEREFCAVLCGRNFCG